MTKKVALQCRILLINVPPDLPPFAGFTEFPICNSYFEANIPLWRDDVPLDRQSIAKWKKEWSDQQAAEVLDAIGAVVICLDRSSPAHMDLGLHLLRNVYEVFRQHFDCESRGEHGPLLLALSPISPVAAADAPWSSDNMDRLCYDAGGWEFIDLDPTKQHPQRPDICNFYIQEKTGTARLREVLEANILDSSSFTCPSITQEDIVLTQDPAHQGIDTLDEYLVMAGGVDRSEHHKDNIGILCKGETSSMTTNQKDTKQPSFSADDEVDLMEDMLNRLRAIRNLDASLSPSHRRVIAKNEIDAIMRRI